jgi:hypothetical protein
MNEYPKFQWSGVFTKQINGVSVNENYTGRFETEQDMNDFIDRIYKQHMPSAQTFPNDEGTRAHTATQPPQPICGVHKTAMTLKPAGVSKKTGKPYPAFWSCGQPTDDGGYCNYRPQN